MAATVIMGNNNGRQLLFSLLRSALCGVRLAEEERKRISLDLLTDLLEMSSRHDIAHLLVLGLRQNDLLPSGNAGLEKHILQAVYRYERQNAAYDQLCPVLEAAQIPFIPLKGTVLREYYPEPWMRTSCDIDILVHKADLNKAAAYLSEALHYVEKKRSTHDISLFTPAGIHVELHFDLVEEGRANHANSVLRSVWENVSLREGYQYQYEMTDAFFYFYHIAHMAKHFENGGCGIRSFIDLWTLDHISGADRDKRDALLLEGGSLQFADASRKLSRVWFEGEKTDDLSIQLRDYILPGGVYGSFDNGVVLQQREKGGKLGYILSRAFIPYAALKCYYPVLEKHPWLMPAMQLRRWLKLLKPDVALRAKRELSLSVGMKKTQAEEMNFFLKNMGL